MNKEQPIHNYNKGITLKDLEEVAKYIQESQKHNEEELEAREKQNFENIAYLSKRAKELGKDIPNEVLIRTGYMSHIAVGSDYYEKYKEWFE